MKNVGLCLSAIWFACMYLECVCAHVSVHIYMSVCADVGLGCYHSAAAHGSI